MTRDLDLSAYCVSLKPIKIWEFLKLVVKQGYISPGRTWLVDRLNNYLVYLSSMFY